jgi:hypothetical protein
MIGALIDDAFNGIAREADGHSAPAATIRASTDVVTRRRKIMGITSSLPLPAHIREAICFALGVRRSISPRSLFKAHAFIDDKGSIGKGKTQAPHRPLLCKAPKDMKIIFL